MSEDASDFVTWGFFAFSRWRLGEYDEGSLPLVLAFGTWFALGVMAIDECSALDAVQTDEGK